LERLEIEGKLARIRGGAANLVSVPRTSNHTQDKSKSRKLALVEAIGRAAAGLCDQGDNIIIDGGSTTLHMCTHLEPLGLQVLTNSMCITAALLPQTNTHICITGGTFFREQGVLLNPFDDDATRGFHATKMFLNVASVSRYGLAQSDVILIQSERRLFPAAKQLIALVESCKFAASASHILCSLADVHTMITDEDISEENANMVEEAGVRLITVSEISASEASNIHGSSETPSS